MCQYVCFLTKLSLNGIANVTKKTFERDFINIVTLLAIIATGTVQSSTQTFFHNAIFCNETSNTA